jgi:hypothetical protein
MKDLCKMEKCPRLFLVFVIFSQLLFDLFVGAHIAINYGMDTGGFLISVTIFCIAIIATIIYEVE